MLLVGILAGFFDGNIRRADCFVGFLGAGVFGLKVAYFEVFLAVSVFDLASHACDGLLAKVK